MAAETYEPRINVVHQALIQPLLVMGVEWRLFITNLVVFVSICVHMGLWYLIFVALLTHLLLRTLARKDSITRMAYIRYQRQADILDPWPHAVQRYNHRPVGYGRGMLC